MTLPDDTLDAAAPPPSGAIGLLLSRDLIFIARVTSTARALGQRVLTTGDPGQAGSMIERFAPRVLFIDLAAGDLVGPAALRAFKQLAPETPFMAFGSHVDAAALAAAAAAGCDPVLPRSRFTAELPTLIRRYLGAAPPA